MGQTCFRTFLGVVVATGLVAGCGLTVKSDVNHALITSVHCGSYAWAGSFSGSSPLRNTVASPLNEERLRTAIASHLGAGTVVQPPGSPADCLLGYGIGTTYVVSGGWGYPYGWGYGYGPYWGYGWGYGWGGPYVYPAGIIAVDLYDARTRQPMWHASVDQSLEGTDGEKATQRINEAVVALFAKYPVSPASTPPQPPG